MAATPPSSFSSLQGLYDLADRDGVDIRQTLLRVLTDLYVQKAAHNEQETAQYVELAQRLAEVVDAATRAAVTARLAAYPAAPSPSFARLAAQLGFRPRLAAPSVSPAASTRPAQNRNDLVELFFAAQAEERRHILGGLNDLHTKDRRQALPRAADICRKLETAALARNKAQFAQVLERELGMPAVLALRAAEDPLGEPILIIARALDMAEAALQRILLLLNPAIGTSVQRVYELSNLYGEISPQAAWRMIEIWNGGAAPAAPKAPHQSVLYDDTQSSARAAATPSRYGSARRSESLISRYKTSGR
jgi:hypothetical protein